MSACCPVQLCGDALVAYRQAESQAIWQVIGSLALRLISPGKVLAFNAMAAVLLLLVNAGSSEQLVGYSLLAVGLANSVMFPTIFSLACEKLGPRAAEGSGSINVAVFGGAVAPVLFGLMPDMTEASRWLSRALKAP